MRRSSTIYKPEKEICEVIRGLNSMSDRFRTVSDLNEAVK